MEETKGEAERLSETAKFNQSKLEELTAFMHEIITDAIEVAEKILSIRQRLKSQLFVKESCLGLLKRSFHLYSDCF